MEFNVERFLYSKQPITHNCYCKVLTNPTLVFPLSILCLSFDFSNLVYLFHNRDPFIHFALSLSISFVSASPIPLPFISLLPIKYFLFDTSESNFKQIENWKKILWQIENLKTIWPERKSGIRMATRYAMRHKHTAQRHKVFVLVWHNI